MCTIYQLFFQNSPTPPCFLCVLGTSCFAGCCEFSPASEFDANCQFKQRVKPSPMSIGDDIHKKKRAVPACVRNCSDGFPIPMGKRFCAHAGRQLAEKTEVVPALQLGKREY